MPHPRFHWQKHGKINTDKFILLNIYNIWTKSLVFFGATSRIRSLKKNPTDRKNPEWKGRLIGTKRMKEKDVANVESKNVTNLKGGIKSDIDLVRKKGNVVGWKNVSEVFSFVVRVLRDPDLANHM